MDSIPPRPPNLSELAEMGERAKERMQAQRAAAQIEAAQRGSQTGRIGLGARIGAFLRRLRPR